MRKRWQKKIITCVTALAMTVTIFPQSWLLKSEKAKAATREPDITRSEEHTSELQSLS